MNRINTLVWSLVFVMASSFLHAMQPARGIKITLNLYSGRPNPTFVLTEGATMDEVKRLLAQLPVDDTRRPEREQPSLLGYSGMEVESLDEALPQVKSLKVFRSRVEVKKATKAKEAPEAAPELRADASQQLEKLLIKEALLRGVIDRDTFDYLSK